MSAAHRERSEKIRSARALLGEVREAVEFAELSERISESEPDLGRAVRECLDKLLTAQEQLCDVVEGLAKESGST